MFDSWIVGRSPDTRRNYVVHAVSPRFILEIVELEHEAWKAGALVWLDDPGAADATRWSEQAGALYFRALRGAGASIGTDSPESDSQRLQLRLFAAEESLRAVIAALDPDRPGDLVPMKQIQEAFGVVAEWRVALEHGRWTGRSFGSPADGIRS